eukprot:364705-Chlamydomonas_euryale.AAC.24
MEMCMEVTACNPEFRATWGCGLLHSQPCLDAHGLFDGSWPCKALRSLADDRKGKQDFRVCLRAPAGGGACHAAERAFPRLWWSGTCLMCAPTPPLVVEWGLPRVCPHAPTGGGVGLASCVPRVPAATALRRPATARRRPAREAGGFTGMQKADSSSNCTTHAATLHA